MRQEDHCCDGIPALRLGEANRLTTGCREYRRLHGLRLKSQRDQHLGHAEEKTNAQCQFRNLFVGILFLYLGDLIQSESAWQANQVIRELQGCRFPV